MLLSNINEANKMKFEQLYVKYKSSMLNYATKTMGSETHSEDIVHEAFIKIINHIDDVGDIDSEKTKCFIVTIVRNICVDYLAKEKK